MLHRLSVICPRNVSQERPLPPGPGSIVRRKDPAHHVLVDVDRKREGDLLGDPRTAPHGIAPLHRNNGIHHRVGWPLGAGAAARG